jgi:hypothetical protein
MLETQLIKDNFIVTVPICSKCQGESTKKKQWELLYIKVDPSKFRMKR